MRLVRSVFFAVGLVTSVFAARCTESEEATYNTANKAVSLDCRSVLDGFNACSDGCLESYSVVAKAASNCTTGVTGSTTLQKAASDMLAKCEEARSNTTNKYIPQPDPSAPQCFDSKITDWDFKYGVSNAFSDCNTTALQKKTCTDECLKTIEQGISEAPTCRATSEYTFQESKKYVLLRCLNARGDDLATNKVLQTVGTVSNSDASSKSESPSIETSTPTPTSGSAVPQVAATLTATAVYALVAVL